MTDDNHTLTDNQNDQTLNFLRDEIASLKSRLTKKDERIASLDVMLNTVMESHNAEVRAYEDWKDKLDDVIEKLRNRVPHDDIFEYGVRHSYLTILNFLPRIKFFSIFPIDCLKTPSSMSLFSALLTPRLITTGSRLK